MKKEIEVYNYVRENANEFLSVIIKALTDGVNEENKRLREEKSKVESGLVVLSFKVKLKKLSKQFKETLMEAYNNCSFFKFDSCKEELTQEPTQ